MRTPTGAFAAGLLASCTLARPPAPAVTSVEPARAAAGSETVLAIRGSGFVPFVRADLDHPDESDVDAGFTVEIVAGPERIALSRVRLLSESELAATVLAGSAAPAVYDVAVTDPRGRAAVLARALEVVACAPEGEACDDGDACTRTDACQAGACVGGDPVVCPQPPACHAAGACDPATGLCSDPVPLTGTACDDGDPCTRTDACQAGACAGGDPVVCPPPPDACHAVGACDPATGACSPPAPLTGTACDDGDPCTGPDLCEAGTCASGPPICSGGTNTPPLACLEVSPTSGTAGTTTFALDASCSTDAEDSPSALTFRFAFDYGPGWTAWDTAASSSPIATTTYPSPGIYTAAAEVTDSGAPQGHPLHAYAYRIAVVTAAADVAWVTNANDTGAGSFRAAVDAVNAANGPSTIAFAIEPSLPATATIALLGQIATLTRPGAVIVGRPGLTLDFSKASNQTCFVLGANGQKVIGVTAIGCAAAVKIPAGLTGVQIAETTLVGPGTAVANSKSIGIDVQSPAAIGPRNDVSGFGTGVRVTAGGAQTIIDGNLVHSNIYGIAIEGAAATVQRNVLVGNGGSYTQYKPALEISSGTGAVLVRFNVFDANLGDGLHALTVPLDVRNNLFTSNGVPAAGYGVNAPAADFAPPGALGPNGFFANGLGAIQGAAPGATDVTVDPLYVSPASADYRLRGASLAIDAGVEIGLDVNGPSPGNYDGAAPDLGAMEYPDFRIAAP